jgi:transcriptional regulator with XRE-family HTH domain
MMAARRAAGIRRLHAAQALGVTESAINGYEQGRTDPSASVLVMMAWLYKTRVEKLCRPRDQVLAEAAEVLAADDDDVLAARTG